MTDKKMWHYKQNNSGGFYEGPAYHIVVEADNEKDAWEKAQKLGASNDSSCPCCGDRWYRVPFEMKSDWSLPRSYVIYADSALEDQDDSHRSIPLVIGCPESRKGEFRISCTFENFEKNKRYVLTGNRSSGKINA